MNYSIANPFVYYSRDFMVLQAAFAELVIRKVLQDNGFEHSKFTAEFSPEDPEGFDSLPEMFDFLGSVFHFMGYEINIPDVETMRDRIDYGEDFHVKIEVPELNGLSRYRISKHKEKWMDLLRKRHFFEIPCTTEIKTNKDKKSTLVLEFNESLYGEWPGIGDLVFNFCEFRKSIKEVVSQNGDGINESELGSEYPMSA